MIEGRHFRNAEARRRTLAEAIDRYVADEVSKKRNGGMYAFTMPWWKKNLGYLRLSEVTPVVLVEQRGKLARESTRVPSQNRNGRPSAASQRDNSRELCDPESIPRKPQSRVHGGAQGM